MTDLNSLSVAEAASKAIEVMLYGEYTEALKPSRWSEGFKGTFEEYLEENYDRYYFNDEAVTRYDTGRMWRHIKYEGKNGSYDGLTAKVEAQYGGEGQGDEFWLVMSITDGLTTRFLRRDGWYSSYGDGGQLDTDTFEVKPQERTVVFYE